MNQSQQQFPAPRRTNTYNSQHDELHMSGLSPHGQMSPREYQSTGNTPHIKLDQAPSNPSQYQNNSSVPNVLQPGGMGGGRPAPMSANTAPTLPTMQASMSQQPEYQTPSKPPSLSLSHSYSRSSPAAGGSS